MTRQENIQYLNNANDHDIVLTWLLSLRLP